MRFHSAAIQDRDGAGLVLDKIRRRFPWLELIWADGGYNAWQADAAVAKVPLLRMEIVKRSDDMKGVVVLPRRWVVERTFSWFGRNRRLAKDFENLAETLATFVTLASMDSRPSPTPGPAALRQLRPFARPNRAGTAPTARLASKPTVDARFGLPASGGAIRASNCARPVTLKAWAVGPPSGGVSGCARGKVALSEIACAGTSEDRRDG